MNPPEISDAFESNVPSPDERLKAMQKCARAGYPLRAVIMPIIPTDGWQNTYADFMENLLKSVPLSRITLGQICSFPAALRLTERKLGKPNPISNLLRKSQSKDGRIRFGLKLRIEVYKHLADIIKNLQPRLEIGLCMEENQTFKALNMETTIGRCNCVL